MIDSAYHRWLASYRERREAVRAEVMGIWAEAFEIDSRAGFKENSCTDGARRHIRARRESLRQRFCLLLWSGGFDETLFRELSEEPESQAVDPDHARGLMRHKSGNFRPRIARMTARLDLAERYALMLWPANREDPPPEPLLLTPPAVEGGWYYVFTLAVELAEAIVIEANYGRGLEAELHWIRRVGLDGRVLLFDNNDELYRFDGDRRWPLDAVGEAVEFAAAQPAAESR